MLSPRPGEELTSRNGLLRSQAKPPRDPRASIDAVKAKQQALETAANTKRREKMRTAQRKVQQQNAELKRRQQVCQV